MKPSMPSSMLPPICRSIVSWESLLIQEGREPEAIAKFSVVAHAYGVRGEVNQASKLLRRIIQLSPLGFLRSHAPH